MDLVCNTSLAITGTWLTKKDDFKTWDISPKAHERYGNDRYSRFRNEEGGLFIYFPLNFEKRMDMS